MISIDANSGDDARYIEIVQRVVNSLVDRDPPDALTVVRIDNWFGDRWHGFIGKTLGALGVRGGRLVIPPFVPSRVVSESSWSRDGQSYSSSDREPLHIKISSEANFSRYFNRLCPETTVVWFSSQSASNGRGSIMAYSDVRMVGTGSWFVELSSDKAWEPVATSGITGREFQSRYIKARPSAEAVGAVQPATAPKSKAE